MATAEAKARRRGIVQNRLTESMAALAERLGIDLPESGPPVRDPELAAIVDLERQADVLDAILAAQATPTKTAKKRGEA